MSLISRVSWRTRVILSLTFALVLTFSSTAFALASSVTLVRLSNDPYTNSTSQHKTEVEPDNYSFGSTIVMATQVGRFFDGGSSNVGWATSTDSGSTWKHGFLPGTSVYATPAGTFARVSDPAVAYDASHKTWLISTLAIANINGSPTGAAVIVNQSLDGGLVWKNPVMVATVPQGGFLDKDWIVCDNTSTSPYFGHCYAEWDNANSGDLIQMSTSTDGGTTWGSAKTTANRSTGLGGQPLVQPNGTVIVPYLGNNIADFISNNGGTSWSGSVTIATVNSHTEAGNLRSGPLPSAEIDGAGKVYVVWEDCRFESGCSANDIVMSTSTNGTTWSAVQRIPIDAKGSGVDHFIPGIAADKSTSGNTAHLALTYYYYPVSNCGSSCQLDVGYVSSTNGGSTWTSNLQLAGPMQLSWLAPTNQGAMVGDYISTTIDNGKTFPALALAQAPGSGTLHESLYTVATGLTVASGSNTSSDRVVSTAGHTTFIRFTAF